MSDPFKIFADNPSKQGTLKALWPELYACLSRTDGPKRERVVYCALKPCTESLPANRPVAVARAREGGPPACARHVILFADRPGGWPLERSP